MTSYLILLLMSLTVWRGSELLAFDAGPFRMFKALRGSCKGHPVLCELLTCPYCCSGHLSFFAAAWLFYFKQIELWQSPLWWFAIWGGAMFIFRVVRERE